MPGGERDLRSGRVSVPRSGFSRGMSNRMCRCMGIIMILEKISFIEEEINMKFNNLINFNKYKGEKMVWIGKLVDKDKDVFYVSTDEGVYYRSNQGKEYDMITVGIVASVDYNGNQLDQTNINDDDIEYLKNIDYSGVKEFNENKSIHIAGQIKKWETILIIKKENK